MEFWLPLFFFYMPWQCLFIRSLFPASVPQMYLHFIVGDFTSFLIHQAEFLTCHLVSMRTDCPCTWTMLSLKANELCWNSLLFRDTSSEIPPTSSLKKKKFLFLKSKVYYLMMFCSHASQVQNRKFRNQDHKILRSIIGDDQFQDHLRNLNVHKSMGPNEIHP